MGNHFGISTCWLRFIFIVPLLLTVGAMAERPAAQLGMRYTLRGPAEFVYREKRDEFSVKYPPSYVDHLRRKSAVYAQDISTELSRTLGYLPQRPVRIDFVTPEVFEKRVGALEWTHAVYHNNVVTVRLREALFSSPRKLERLIRHEYVHATVAALSAGRCPAWFEEGLAQEIEGGTRRNLSATLRNHLQHGSLIPFERLRDNFALLDPSLVRVAYAQSLYAVRSLIRRFGFADVRRYLAELSRNSRTDAFRNAFGLTPQKFEGEIEVQLRRWAASQRAEF